MELDKTILLVHGIEGHSKENWFLWLKKEFEGRGYKVIIPDLPNANSPKLEEWIKALEGFKKDFTKELIIIAHSLGAPTACVYIQKNNLKVKKLILVAPTGKNQTEENWKNLRDAGVREKEINIIKSFNGSDINYRKINELVSKTVIYLSENDPFIPLSVQDNYKELNPCVRSFKDKGHFNASAGVVELPEIIDDIEDVSV